jgi:crossover junction endodeoxyribonuclease RuvC
MLVLGFDPGTATTGYGVVQYRNSRLFHVTHGAITTPAGESFSVRLKLLFHGCQRLIDEYRPDAVAVEKLFFNRNITTGIAVAQARGVIALAASLAGYAVDEYSPLEVKNAVVGYGKATKSQVQEMVKLLLNLKAIPKPDDAADALALAICRAQTARLTSLPR